MTSSLVVALASLAPRPALTCVHAKMHFQVMCRAERFSTKGAVLARGPAARFGSGPSNQQPIFFCNTLKGSYRVSLSCPSQASIIPAQEETGLGERRFVKRVNTHLPRVYPVGKSPEDCEDRSFEKETTGVVAQVLTYLGWP